MKDQTENPSAASGNREEAFAEFFDQYSLPESKSMLWNWYKATTTGTFTELKAIERENITTFYERLAGLIDAVYALKIQEDK